jgi:hypothetical protein
MLDVGGRTVAAPCDDATLSQHPTSRRRVAETPEMDGLKPLDEPRIAAGKRIATFLSSLSATLGTSQRHRSSPNHAVVLDEVSALADRVASTISRNNVRRPNAMLRAAVRIDSLLAGVSGDVKEPWIVTVCRWVPMLQVPIFFALVVGKNGLKLATALWRSRRQIAKLSLIAVILFAGFADFVFGSLVIAGARQMLPARLFEWALRMRTLIRLALSFAGAVVDWLSLLATVGFKTYDAAMFLVDAFAAVVTHVFAGVASLSNLASSSVLGLSVDSLDPRAIATGTTIVRQCADLFAGLRGDAPTTTITRNATDDGVFCYLESFAAQCAASKNPFLAPSREASATQSPFVVTMPMVTSAFLLGNAWHGNFLWLASLRSSAVSSLRALSRSTFRGFAFPLWTSMRNALPSRSAIASILILASVFAVAVAVAPQPILIALGATPAIELAGMLIA